MAKIRDYEVIIVIQPDQEEADRKAFIETFSERLTHGEGEAAKPQINLWGKRTLAYPIQKFTEGFYVFYEAKLDGTQIRPIERDLTYNENILRFLFVRKEEEAVQEEQ